MKATGKAFLLSLAMGASAALPTVASAGVAVDIEVAPPPVRVETVPPPRGGYIWAPGYWAWRGGAHVWVPGRWMHERRGWRWVPDAWVQVGPRWHYRRGHWER